MKTNLIIISCLLFALCGCNNNTTIQGTSFAGKAYTLKFPSDWTVLKKPMAGIDQIAQSPMEGSSDKFRENVNVVLENVPPNMSEQEYLDASLAAMKQMINLDDDLKHTKTKVGSYDGYHMQYSMTMQGRTIDNDIYIVIANGGSYLITCSHAKGKREKFKPTVDSIIDSFKIVN